MPVVYTNTAGSFVQIGSAGSATFTEGDTWKVTANGTALEVFQNGVSRWTGTSSFGTSNTKHGLRANSSPAATFDNFSITDIGGGGTATGLATETDTALALAAKQTKPTGLATETDSALGLTTTAGFDFHTAAGLIFGDLAGALTGLARQSAVAMTLRVYAVASPGALVHESGTLTTDSNGRLARYQHASLSAGTAYHCVFIRASDGELASVKLQAT